METVDLQKLASLDEGEFASDVASSSENMVALVWVLSPHHSMPELTFSRSDVLYLVLEGALHVMVDRQCHRLEIGQALSVARQVCHQSRNSGDGPVRVVLVRTPGPVRLEKVGLGRVECPICAAALPLQKGDRAEDRFVCNDCGFVMTLEEHEGFLRPARFEPEFIDG